MSALPRPARPALAAAAGLLLLAGCTTDAGRDRPPTVTAGTGTAGTPTASAPTSPTVGGEDLVVHATEVPPLHPSVDGYSREQIEIATGDGARHRLAVLVARTPEERAHGLMEVSALPDGVGMLFVGYEEDRTGGFWMKDTLVPLTIAYLAADGTIVQLVDMEPCPEDPCPSYPPDRPYRSALEVRQGWFDANGIAPGDVVRRVQA